MLSNDFKLLDCTMRDGGYLNNWSFDKKFAREYLLACVKTGVDDDAAASHLLELSYQTIVATMALLVNGLHTGGHVNVCHGWHGGTPDIDT